MTKLKIAFCTNGIYPLTVGGMQKHSRLLIEELSGFPDLALTVIHPHQVPIFNTPNIDEIRIDDINPEKNYLMERYRYSRRVAEILKSKDFDIIYSQGLSVWDQIKTFKDKLIINPHGLEPYQAIGIKNKIIAIPFKLVFNRLFNNAAIVLSLGGKLTGILSSHTRDNRKIHEIPNGVNLIPFEPKISNNNKTVVLFLARFAHNKGIDILFSSIKELNKRNELEHFQFILGGSGPLFEYYKRENKFKNVRLLGHLSDEEVPKFYQLGDVFVLPTLFEGMPTVVMEAMVYGLPIIVTDVGATSSLVSANNGLLIKKNSVKALVGALLAFRSLDENKRREMGLASRDAIREKFTWEHVAQCHNKLFYQLADK